MSLSNDCGIPAVMNVTPTNAAYNGNNGGWGGDWGAWIVIFLLFGMWGFGGWGGFGGFGGGWGGNNAGLQGALTRGDLCSEFSFNDLQNAVRGVQQGICDSTFALNNSINSLGTTTMQGFNSVNQGLCNLGYNVQQGINSVNTNMMQGFNSANVVALQNQNALQAQLSSCCCDTQRAIDGVNYNMATNTCNITNTLNNNTRDIIDSQNAGTRAILDYLCQDKISTLQNENQALRLAASQSAQNNVIGARIDAATAEILRKTGAECPLPAYVVQPPQPVTFPTNCCGQANYAGTYGGCGCGC